MKIFNKILCRFGIHNWEYFGFIDKSKYCYRVDYRICKNCKRIDEYRGRIFVPLSLKDAVKLNIDEYLNLTKLVKIVNLKCHVCGYYCLGKGGKGCIDKRQMYKDEITRLNKLYYT